MLRLRRIRSEINNVQNNYLSTYTCLINCESITGDVMAGSVQKMTCLPGQDQYS